MQGMRICRDSAGISFKHSKFMVLKYITESVQKLMAIELV